MADQSGHVVSIDDVNALKAAAMLAAQDDSRPVLAAVHISGGEVQATDGFLAIRIKRPALNGKVLLTAKSVLGAIKSLSPKERKGFLHLRLRDPGEKADLLTDGGVRQIESLDQGVFPDFDAHVWPGREVACSMALNPDKLGDIVKAIKASAPGCESVLVSFTQKAGRAKLQAAGRTIPQPMSAQFTWMLPDDHQADVMLMGMVLEKGGKGALVADLAGGEDLTGKPILPETVGKPEVEDLEAFDAGSYSTR